MIITALINLASFIANTLLVPFPTSSGFPTEVNDAIAFIGSYAGILDPIVPIQTLATVVGLVVTFELAVFAFKGLRWLVSHVPFVGGRG
jgi:hypothetical protein